MNISKGIVTETIRSASNLCFCVVAALLVCCLPLAAQQADSRDEAELLAQLGEATPTTAPNYEAQLIALWSASGSAAMDLLLQRGRDAIDAQDYVVAVEHLTALTDHAPEFADGWLARATVFFMMGRYGLALSDLEMALALNPNHFEAIIGLGVILEEIGADRLAYQAFQRAASIHPHHEAISPSMDRLRPLVDGDTL
jgi:tetratricopeptide (TPR) repeat protein